MEFYRLSFQSTIIKKVRATPCLFAYFRILISNTTKNLLGKVIKSATILLLVISITFLEIRTLRKS